MTNGKAPRNRTLSCSELEISRLSQSLTRLTKPVAAADLEGAIVNQDLFEAATFLPKNFADLLIIDPALQHLEEFQRARVQRKRKRRILLVVSVCPRHPDSNAEAPRHGLRVLRLEDIHAYCAHLGPAAEREESNHLGERQRPWCEVKLEKQTRRISGSVPLLSTTTSTLMR